MAEKKARKATTPSITKERLRELVEQATVDAYGDEEQRVGFFTMMEDHLAFPFETRVLGTPVTVTAVEMTDAEEIAALCVAGRERQRIPILDLPLPLPRPKGWEWIEAYRHWANPS